MTGRRSHWIHDDASLGDLFSSLTTDLGQLVRSEMELAKVEIREEAGKASKAAGLLAGGALAGYLALILLSFAAAWGLAEVVDAGWAFLIVGLIVATVAAALAITGRQKLRDVQPAPDHMRVKAMLVVPAIRARHRWCRWRRWRHQRVRSPPGCDRDQRRSPILEHPPERLEGPASASIKRILIGRRRSSGLAGAVQTRIGVLAIRGLGAAA